VLLFCILHFILISLCIDCFSFKRHKCLSFFIQWITKIEWHISILPVSPKRKAAILHYLKCWRFRIFDNEFLTLLLRIPKKSSNFRIISFYSAIPRDVMEHGTRANVIRNALRQIGPVPFIVLHLEISGHLSPSMRCISNKKPRMLLFRSW